MTQRQLIVAGKNGCGQCILPVAQNIGVSTLAPLDWLDDDCLVLRAAGGNVVTLLLEKIYVRLHARVDYADGAERMRQCHV